MTMHPTYQVLNKMMKYFQFNALFIHLSYTQILLTDYEKIKSMSQTATKLSAMGIMANKKQYMNCKNAASDRYFMHISYYCIPKNIVYNFQK